MTQSCVRLVSLKNLHRAIVGLGIIGAFHFAISLFMWALLLRLPGGIPRRYLLHHASPAVILFLGFLIVLALAWRSRSIAVPLLSLCLIGAASCFWYDVSHEYCQLRIMGTDLVCRPSYATWFWYQGP